MTRVVLVEKRRPSYLFGRLVGIGGKLEPGETSAEAMIREFREETGVHHEEWRPILSYRGDLNQYIDVFMAIGDVDACQTTTDESIIVVPVAALPQNVYHNCRWVIPMCLDERAIDGRRSIVFAQPQEVSYV